MKFHIALRLTLDRYGDQYKLTGKEIASRVGVTQQTISKFLNGENAMISSSLESIIEILPPDARSYFIGLWRPSTPFDPLDLRMQIDEMSDAEKINLQKAIIESWESRLSTNGQLGVKFELKRRQARREQHESSEIVRSAPRSRASRPKPAVSNVAVLDSTMLQVELPPVARSQVVKRLQDLAHLSQLSGANWSLDEQSLSQWQLKDSSGAVLLSYDAIESALVLPSSLSDWLAQLQAWLNHDSASIRSLYPRSRDQRLAEQWQMRLEIAISKADRSDRDRLLQLLGF